jgi:hypothetical protein
LFPLPSGGGRLRYVIYLGRRCLRDGHRPARKRWRLGPVDVVFIDPAVHSWIGHASHADTMGLRRSLPMSAHSEVSAIFPSFTPSTPVSRSGRIAGALRTAEERIAGTGVGVVGVGVRCPNEPLIPPPPRRDAAPELAGQRGEAGGSLLPIRVS